MSRIAPEVTSPPITNPDILIEHIDQENSSMLSSEQAANKTPSRIPPIVQPFPRNPNPQTASEGSFSMHVKAEENEESESVDVEQGDTLSGMLVSDTTPASDETDNAATQAQPTEVVIGSNDGGASLPSHLSNLSPEEREALQQRMTREMAIDEARNLEPRRKIDRNAKQLYCSAIGTSTFLILLVLKIEEVSTSTLSPINLV